MWILLSSYSGFEFPINVLELLIPSTAFLPCKIFIYEISLIGSVQVALPVNEPGTFFVENGTLKIWRDSPDENNNNFFDPMGSCVMC